MCNFGIGLLQDRHRYLFTRAPVSEPLLPHSTLPHHSRAKSLVLCDKSAAASCAVTPLYLVWWNSRWHFCVSVRTRCSYVTFQELQLQRSAEGIANYVYTIMPSVSHITLTKTTRACQ